MKDDIRCNALKIIILIGRARSSAEDLLIAYSIIKTSELQFNFDQELSRFAFDDVVKDEGKGIN